VYVVVLDAVPMIIAMGAFIFTPPAKLLRDQGARLKIDGSLKQPASEGNKAPVGSGSDVEMGLEKKQETATSKSVAI